MPDAQPTPHRFRCLTIDDVAEELATSRRRSARAHQATRAARAADRGRGQWRIERAKLEAYIQAAYVATERELDKRRRSIGE